MNRIVSDLLTVKKFPNATHWNVENGYDSSVDEKHLYPNRTIGVGFDGASSVMLSSHVEHLRCENSFIQTFLVAVHSPDQFPRLPSDFIKVPFQHITQLYVKPNVMTISDGLRSLEPNERGCYFQNERRLEFFSSYNQYHCELECLANHIKEKCDCVDFWMPSEYLYILFPIMNAHHIFQYVKYLLNEAIIDQ